MLARVPRGPVPALVAVGLLLVGSLVVGSRVLYAANVAPNPGFETLCGSLPCNWSATGSGAIASSTTAHTGSRSVQVTSSALASPGTASSDCITGLADGSYDGSVWINAPSTNVASVQMSVDFFSDSGCTAALTPSLSSGAQGPGLTNNWKQITLAGSAPSGSRAAIIRLTPGCIFPGCSTFFDDVVLNAPAGAGGTATATTTGGTGNPAFITPVRVVDTRASAPGIVHTGFDQNGNAISVGPILGGDPATPEATTRRFKIAGQTFGSTTIPADVRALLLNVTSIAGGASGGYLIVFPGQASAPLASTLNPVTPVAFNFWTTAVAPANGPSAGTIGVFSTTTLDLAIDVVGYYR